MPEQQGEGQKDNQPKRNMDDTRSNDPAAELRKMQGIDSAKAGPRLHGVETTQPNAEHPPANPDGKKPSGVATRASHSLLVCKKIHLGRYIALAVSPYPTAATVPNPRFSST